MLELRHLDSLLVATLRHVGPHDPSLTSDTWQDLIVWASPRRLLGRHPEVRGVGLLWDDPTTVPADERRYDVGVPIDEADIPAVELPMRVLRTLPGEYLHLRHVGDYERLPFTYESALGISMLAEGMRLAAAPALELYRNSSAEVPTDELLTDIYLPVVRV
jgi:AraC family transcriptional regulator